MRWIDLTEKKIEYKGKNYDKVLFLMYKSSEQIQELAYIALKDCWREIKNHEDKLELQVDRVDKYNLTFIIKQSNKIIRRILVPAIIIHFPTVKAAIDSNTKAQEIFEEDGVYGLYGIRDKKLLEHIIFSTEHSVYFGEDKIPTIIRKAAAYWYKFSKYQVFLNGNKRTGLLLCLLLLEEGCMKYSYTKDEMYNLAQKIAVGKISTEQAYNFLLNGITFDYSKMYNLYNSLDFKEKLQKNWQLLNVWLESFNRKIGGTTMERFNIITSKNIMENLTEIKTAPLSEKDIKKATMNVLKNKEVYGAMKALSTK